MLKLKYAYQNYAWGHFGEDSEVYNLLIANGTTDLDPKLPYAELWLGTHVSGPSSIESPKISLDKFIKENPEMMGEKSLNVFGPQIPFLMKVLSVRTALSIQIHPNKKDAELLHKCAPEIYKDPNHKPEIAIALTWFEALVGFRSLDQITFFIKSVPQLGRLIGEVRKEYLNLINEEQKRASLKVCYKRLMNSPADEVTSAVQSLVSDFRNGKAVEYLSHEHAYLGDLFLRLSDQYPNDIGLFCVFIFNYITLSPGDSVFLAPNLPHAYISGTIVECMAASDNVIRAGLTPKFKDVETLLTMIDYSSYCFNDVKFSSLKVDSGMTSLTKTLYKPPISDFIVEKIEILPLATFYSIGEFTTGSIIIVIQGYGQAQAETSDGRLLNKIIFNRGNAFFVGAQVSVSFKVQNYACLFRAYVNVD